MQKSTITLAMGSTADQWKSSELYLHRLFNACTSQDSRFEFRSWRSETAGNAILRRRFLVPKEIQEQVKGNLHLLDQSYGDSLLGYTGKSIATVADINFWHERGLNPVRYYLRRRIVQGLRIANHLVAISEATKRELIEYLSIPEASVSVIPFAIDSIFLQEPGPLPPEIEELAKEPFLLHVGSTDPRKGLESLLRTMALDSTLPRLIQVGSSPSRDLRCLVETLNLENRIDFLGIQNDKVIHSLYRKCALFVFPSHYEGFGVPPLEAVASGAKIATTAMPSVIEVLGQSAVLDHNQKIEEWSERLQQILKSPNDSQKLYQGKSKDWTWDSVVKQYLDLYNKVF